MSQPVKAPNLYTNLYELEQRLKKSDVSRVSGGYVIPPGTITGNMIAPGTITAGNIMAGTITANEIFAHTITAELIVAGTITANEIFANTITANQISAHTITADEITARTITANEINAHTITANEIKAGTITAGEIFAGTITANEIHAGTITATQIVAGTITANQISAGTITVNEMAANSISVNQLQAGSVTAVKIAVSTLSAITSNMGGLTAGTITGATLQTALSGSRVVIDSTGLRGYALDGISKSFEINTGSGIATLTGIVFADPSSVIPTTSLSGLITGPMFSGVVGGGNLLKDSSFNEADAPLGTLAWRDEAGGTTYTQDSGVGNFLYGGMSLKAVRTTAVGAITISNDTGRPIVSKSTPYTASVYLRTTSGAAGTNFNIRLQFYDSNGVQTGTDVNSTAVAVPTTDFVRLRLTTTSPADAYKCRMIIRSTVSTIPVGQGVFIDGAQLEAGDVMTAYAPKPDEILPGFVTGTMIGLGVIGTPNIAVNAINASLIADGAILTAKLADNSIALAKMQANSVANTQLVNNAVDAAKIAAGAVGTAALVDGAVLNSKLDDLSVSLAKLQSGSVGSTQLIAGSVIAGKIAANAVTANEIAARTIVAGDIAADTITANEIKANTITANNIAAATITAGQIAAGTIVSGNINAGAITTTELAALAVTTAKIAAGAITANEIAAGAVTASKITIVPGGGNQMTNSSFENGTLFSTDWTPFSGTIIAETTQVHNGGTSARMNATGAGAGLAWEPSGKRVQVQPGDSVTLSIWVRPQPSGKHVDLVARGWTAITGGSVAGTVIASGVLIPQNTWTRIVGTYTVPATGVAAVGLRLNITDAGSGEVYFFDDAQIEQGDVASSWGPKPDEILPSTVTGGTGGMIAGTTITGGNIVTGTITATQMAAHTITANEIAALTITAGELAADSVTTAKMTANTINGDRITTNTLNASKLVAGTISALQIGAGAIETNALAAGAVTAQKMTIAFGANNVVTNSSFDNTDNFFADWVQNGGPATLETSVVHNGGQAAKVVASSANPGVIWGGTNRYVVQPGQIVTMSAWVRTSATGRNAEVLARAWTATAGGTVTNVSLGPVTAIATNTWTRVTGTYTVPATGVAAVGIFVRFSNGAVGETFYFDDLQIEDGEVATAWSPKADEILPGTVGNTQLGPDSVTTDKILARTIQAGDIVTGTLTANEIAGATITGAKIAAVTITAANIAANTITASQIASGTITATEIGVGVITADRLSISSGGGNLLPNSNPEFDLTGWTNVSGGNGWLSGTASTFTRDTSQAWIGAASFKAVTTAATANQGFGTTPADGWVKPVSIPAGTPVTVSFYIKLANTINDTNTRIRAHIGKGTATASEASMSLAGNSNSLTGAAAVVTRNVINGSDTTNWQRFSATVTFGQAIPSTSSLRFAIHTGDAVALTFRVSAIQIELGDVLTGYRAPWFELRGPSGVVLDGDGLRFYDSTGVKTVDLSSTGQGLNLLSGTSITPPANRKVTWLSGGLQIGALGATQYTAAANINQTALASYGRSTRRAQVDAYASWDETGAGAPYSTNYYSWFEAISQNNAQICEMGAHSPSYQTSLLLDATSPSPYMQLSMSPVYMKMTPTDVFTYNPSASASSYFGLHTSGDFWLGQGLSWGQDSAGSVEIGNHGADLSHPTAYVWRIGNSTANGNGTYLQIDGSFVTASSAKLKERFQAMPDILDRIEQIAVDEWNYIPPNPEDIDMDSEVFRTSGTTTKEEFIAKIRALRHIGPTAEDFNAQFPTINSVGNDTHIAPADIAGIALGGVKALISQVKLLRQRVKALEDAAAAA